MAKAKKTGGKKKGGAKAATTDAPKIIGAKGGIPQGALLNEVLLTMEDDLRVSKKQGQDFIESLKSAVEKELMSGRPVNLFGMVKVVPRFHTKGQREVNETFGDPTSKKVVKKYPAKVSVKVTPLKPVKDALPTVAKMQKVVG
jgi:hypothetical protein